ncbi:fructosamine kinase family protein [Salipiger mucosus]|uniref:Ribulosamine/erythrulosamine 3-kinase potentially involved in protein deglycation n=1 Tax=Salipiger mucosus DSM 16094 TaxID=1123237 RepID=S9SGI4_9RHOB|nr:fructosamine kinase family protein [Salipiger mucosus]EPX85404.1 Ribulosamine/erythrulosamine 3-kinase potentially involved in protein deglycation [Salipiger mucosus DSM 16094]
MRLERVGDQFGVKVASVQPVHGGDLSEVARVELENGRIMAVKRGPVVDVEARMLKAMALAGAPVPEVLHQVDDLLCLEWLEDIGPSEEGWRKLGEGLRGLHGTGGADYGWPEDYAFGPLPLRNSPRDDWCEFWAEARLRPFLPDLPADLASRVERLADTLTERLPAQPEAALLHGDLWTGNALFGRAKAWMIDPACYHGHAEVDLAMLELFGNPPAAFWQSYGETDPQREDRRPVYQLFPALVHLRLFGDGYRGMVTRMLDAAGV